jgi:hypothetical protein
LSLLNSSSRTKGIAAEAGPKERVEAALQRQDSITVAVFDRAVAAPHASHYLLTLRAIVTPKLTADWQFDRLIVHPTHSSTRAGSNPSLARLPQAVAKDLLVRDDWGCCGFGGDGAMLHSELKASAIAAEVGEVRRKDADGYASCNRAREIGMTQTTGHEYQHVLEVLDAVSVGA